jgi:hypothetical protein
VTELEQADRLRARLREKRESMSSAHATRLHRAVSWLRCAEQYAEADEDLSFIALWVVTERFQRRRH